ncbi:MAG: class I SAM-dependent RNA methyltransferase [Devosia sp.]|uniref:class I SAM-dependent RNA methyltransferase n=1 Tax=Devosia sp. TaxID=1871048 RepID=UPI0024CCB5D5|nr:TRAM domain-containing protein [Devosia sp.]UYN98878.1 MAG: class I SAM-dependent RNA methyltransferase [Devosia sp.]
MSTTVRIESLGHKGEGVAIVDGKRIFVPFVLPGELVTIEIEGERARLLSILEPSPQRIEPICRHFGTCGGCQLQHLDRESYVAFKRRLVEQPLRQAGIEAPIERFVIAHGEGRRRATLHARRDQAGYMQLRSHDLLDLDACPILVPALGRAPDLARAIGAAIGPCDIGFTATMTGMDVTVRSSQRRVKEAGLIPLGNRFGVARLAYNGEMLFQAQAPMVKMGPAQVELPIGSFLQATAEAETVLGDYVLTAVGKARKVADLFCGIGPFALRLAANATVLAADSDRAGIAALDKAARHARGLKAITAKARDLFRDPLTRFELDFDAVVLDPPRAGAEAQVREIAASRLSHVVMVACDPRSFARDAAQLVQAGFMLDQLLVVDQFAWSSHVEMAATFRR